jgi:cell division transport system ATP-binding protein
VATHDEVLVNWMRRRVVELDHGSVVRDQARGVYGIESAATAAAIAASGPPSGRVPAVAGARLRSRGQEHG